MDRTKNYKSRAKQQFSRSVATENRGVSYFNVVLFPSTLALDMHEGFENGILTKKTNIIAVERVRSRRPTMIKQLRKRTRNFQVAKSNAHALNLRKYLKGEKVDYMPFDICGNFTAKLAGWFYRNQPYFADGMRMSITLAAINRNTKTHNLIKKITDNNCFNFVHKALKSALWTAVGGFLLTEEMRENIATQVFLFLCSMPDKHIQVNSISLYSNKGIKKGKFTDMITLDANIYDSPFKNKYRQGIASKVFSLYNEDACYASKVVFADKKKKVKKARKIRTPREITLADKHQELISTLIENGVKHKGIVWITAGQSSLMTRYCNLLDKQRNKVEGSIKSWVRMRTGKAAVIRPKPNRR